MNQPDPPAFVGTSRAAFLRDMEAVCTEMVSVATNYRGQDPRAVLAGRIESPACRGYLLAVRISHETPPELLNQASALYDAIQEHYRTGAFMEGQTNEPA